MAEISIFLVGIRNHCSFQIQGICITWDDFCRRKSVVVINPDSCLGGPVSMLTLVL